MLVGNEMKLIRRILIFALLASGTFWLSKGSTKALLLGPQAKSEARPPTVILTPQEDAPLKIISTWVETLKPQNFKLVAQVQNQSGKEIRAYAINSQVASSKQQNGNSQFMNLTQNGRVWQPTAIRTVEVSDSQEDEIISVRLTVDFVEFRDGSIWGPDVQNSRDILLGQREGARSERERVRQLVRTRGREAAARELETNGASSFESLKKGTHSSQWDLGFQSGAKGMQRRLRIAFASGDNDKINAALTRSFDTSEEEHN